MEERGKANRKKAHSETGVRDCFVALLRSAPRNDRDKSIFLPPSLRARRVIQKAPFIHRHGEPEG